MNFKNKRPRKSRAGCHLCKPHKIMGNSRAGWTAKEHIQHLVIERSA